MTFARADICFIAGVTSFAFGPASWISLCGITSLSITVSVVPRASLTFSDAVYRPLLNDQAWQPRVWWRIVSVGFGALARAEPAKTVVSASANTAVRMRVFLFIVVSSFASDATESAHAPRCGHRRAR